MLTYSYKEAQDARDGYVPDCDGCTEQLSLIELHEQFVTYANAKAWLQDMECFVPRLIGTNDTNRVSYIEEQLELLLEDEHNSK
jgi:hypothetical protein